MLLLDEPTNDLDVATLGALEAMLTDFGGSVLLVSHDRWLLDRVSTSILAFEEAGRLDLQVGHYSDYRERSPRRSRRRERPTAPGAAALAAAPAPGKSAPIGGTRSGAAEAASGDAGATDAAPSAPHKPLKPLHAAERRELSGLLDRIDAAETEVARLQTALADPSLYQSGAEALGETRAALAAAEAEVETLSRGGKNWKRAHRSDSRVGLLSAPRIEARRPPMS